MRSDALRPTRTQLAAAIHRRVPDLIAARLHVLFCGINPGLYSAATGHHFARPGNRFWPTLYAAGFTRRLLSPIEERELLDAGFGITNLVARTTARAEDLRRDELIRGARTLRSKVQRLEPRVLAVVGLGAYRTAFAQPRAGCGLQPATIGDTRIWLLPNPSGINAHHQPARLTQLFTELYTFQSRLAR